MIDFYITEQMIRCASPVIAANSRNFLEGRFYFSGESWNGYSKWCHFRQGETVYDINLRDDVITKEMGLNLSIGLWEVFLTGNMGESRITTIPIYIRVRESGLIDEPLHQIPMSVAEQVDSKASLALQKARELEEAAEQGAFDGKSFQILGYYGSLEELTESVPEPKRGQAYGIGEGNPYDIYIYDGLNECWVNNGSIQGPKGDTGENGACFVPNVDQNGNLSWSNDKGLDNPVGMNIIGAKGDKGDRGDAGKSPYELAVEEGFGGTEATFNWSLVHLASHASQHEAGGTDQLELSTENIQAAAVTGEKIAQGAVSQIYTATIGTEWAGEAAPYTQEITVEGLLETDRPHMDLLLSEDWEKAEKELDDYGLIADIEAENGKLIVRAVGTTMQEVQVQLEVIRK